MIKNTNETITRNIPTPAFVLVISVIDSSKDDALPTKSATSSVIPLLISCAEWAEISENVPDETLKASVKSPTIKEITPKIRTAPAIVKTKSFAVIAIILTSNNRILVKYVAGCMPENLASIWFL